MLNKMTIDQNFLILCGRYSGNIMKIRREYATLNLGIKTSWLRLCPSSYQKEGRQKRLLLKSSSSKTLYTTFGHQWLESHFVTHLYVLDVI